MNNFNNMNNNIIDTSTYFEVKTSKNQTFIINEYDDDFNHNFQIMNKGTLPCVIILIPKNRNTASLQSVSFHPKCCKEGLEKGDGTKYMIQFSLKYIIQKYPHINKIYISDTTSYNLDNGNTSLITPRYLLTGQKGYYQRILNAYPIKSTIESIKIIDASMNEIKGLIPKNITNDWWIPENVYRITDSISPEVLSHTILNTEWEVSKDIINNYNISWEIEPISRPFHGGTQELSPQSQRIKYMKKILRHHKI
jgi:hypothetical protein